MDKNNRPTIQLTHPPTNQPTNQRIDQWINDLSLSSSSSFASSSSLQKVHRGPWFVAAKDAASNTLFVTTRYEDVTAPRLAFGVDDVNWIAGKPPAALATAGAAAAAAGTRAGAGAAAGAAAGASGASPAASSGAGARLTVQVRHGPDTHLATVTPTAVDTGAGNAGGGRLMVQLDGSDKGLAPGQYAAFYDGDVCLGAGVIADRSPDELRACIEEGASASASAATPASKHP